MTLYGGLSAVRSFFDKDNIVNMRICIIPGDGIGPEIMTQAVALLEKTACKFDVAYIWMRWPFLIRPSRMRNSTITS